MRDLGSSRVRLMSTIMCGLKCVVLASDERDTGSLMTEQLPGLMKAVEGCF